MAKRKSTKGAAKLRKIVAKAKAIRRKNPRIKWKTAIKAASKKV
jgi:hypothetical protein